MSATFPSRWPAKNPDHIQAYTFGTPNGRKLTIALEEMELPYDLHTINILKDDQFDPEFVRINPNSKIPAMLDPHGPNDEPIALMESAVILQYLAEKTGKLIPSDAAGRWETLQWLAFQIASVGPMFGQFGHFYMFAKGKTDSYGEERYTKETKRLLGVLDARLADRPFLVGDTYTIADVATFPWVRGIEFYKAEEHLDYASYANVEPWVQRCLARPKTAAGYDVFSS